MIVILLADIFGSGFEEAKFAATEAMKDLIQSCIDEELIKQGIEQITNNSDLNARKSMPSIIWENLC